MQYILSRPAKHITGMIKLPSSKSISNRTLIINSLSYSPYDVQNLSDSDDTRVLQQILTSNSNIFDIGHAGTAMRFLTAFLSLIVGEWHITGSERMKQRPIRVLVNALRELGAIIEYEGEEGFPPLKITGSHLKGKILELDGSISSQYISALLMIAPTLEKGLTLRLKNKIISRSYISLTLELMRKYGIRYNWTGNEIRIEEQTYKPVPFTVESDWSGASYWYQMVALAEQGELELTDLHQDSLQGDRIITEWFRLFGIESKTKENSILIRKERDICPGYLELNFSENPDIAQTMAVLCVLKQVPFLFRGLETLKIKETNRILALQNELAKFGASISEPQNGELQWNGKFSLAKKNLPLISTYHDHRMALAFAPAALYGEIAIEDPLVVTKSYPNYYEDLKKVGFIIKQQL